MYLKIIFKIVNSLLILIVTAQHVFATSRILSGEFISLESNMTILADVNNQKKLIRVNLRDCEQLDTFTIDNSARVMAISQYISSYMLVGGSKLFLYNSQNGKLVNSYDDYIRNVFLISQSDMGQYVVASDGITVGFYQFKKEGLVKLYSKEFSGSVSAIYPDIETNLLYVAERNGKISIWTFSGKLQKNINISYPINAMVYDDKLGQFLVLSSKGLYKLSKENFQSEKIINGKIHSAFIEKYSSKLEVITDAGFTVYDYPVMRQVIALNGVANKIIKSDGANFVALSGINFIKVYDLKYNIHIGTIAIDSLGMVNFYPPDEAYGTNISSSFIAAASGTKEEKKPYDKDKICATFAYMVSGIYSPQSKNIDSISINELEPVNSITIPEIKQVAPVNAPQITFHGGNITVPEVEDVKATPPVTINNNISSIKEPKETISPDEPQVKDISKLVPTNIPNWVANRKNLPKNNAVGSGKTEEEALLTAKSQLKNNMVRKLLNNLVKDKKVDSIENIEGKKRVLWQSTAKAVNSLDSKIYTVDIWKSPAGQYFIHLLMDDTTLIEKGNKYINEEIKKYYSMPFENYIQEKPINLEQ